MLTSEFNFFETRTRFSICLRVERVGAESVNLVSSLHTIGGSAMKSLQEWLEKNSFTQENGVSCPEAYKTLASIKREIAEV